MAKNAYPESTDLPGLEERKTEAGWFNSGGFVMGPLSLGRAAFCTLSLIKKS